MRCKNCGSRVQPGKYCSGCGMLQPPRVAKGLKIAVGLLGMLAVVLLAAVGYVLLKLEPARKAADAPPSTLAALRDAADTPASATEKASQQSPRAQQEESDAASQSDAAEQSDGSDQADQAAQEAQKQQLPLDAAAPEPESQADGQSAQQTVDDEVKAIRAEYDEIESGRQSGRYREQLLRQSVYSWTDDGTPVCIILRSGADGLDFERSYYFTDGQLRFAYLEADDACRLYFKDDELLRLRYAEDATKASASIDYDGAGGEEYDTWNAFALSEGYAVYEDARVASEYVIADSDSRYLTEDDLRGLSANECRLARNEIFARHGRRFADAALQAHFDACSWYTGTTSPSAFDERVFNEYEAANVSLIREYEAAMGYR